MEPVRVKVSRDKSGKLNGALIIFGKYSSWVQIKQSGNSIEFKFGETHHGVKINANDSMQAYCNRLLEQEGVVEDNQGPELLNSEEVR